MKRDPICGWIAAAAFSAGWASPLLAQYEAEMTAEAMFDPGFRGQQTSDPFALTEAVLIDFARVDAAYRSYPVPK